MGKARASKTKTVRLTTKKSVADAIKEGVSDTLLIGGVTADKIDSATEEIITIIGDLSVAAEVVDIIAFLKATDKIIIDAGIDPIIAELITDQIVDKIYIRDNFECCCCCGDFELSPVSICSTTHRLNRLTDKCELKPKSPVCAEGEKLNKVTNKCELIPSPEIIPVVVAVSPPPVTIAPVRGSSGSGTGPATGTYRWGGAFTRWTKTGSYSEYQKQKNKDAGITLIGLASKPYSIFYAGYDDWTAEPKPPTVITVGTKPPKEVTPTTPEIIIVAENHWADRYDIGIRTTMYGYS